MRTRRAFPWVLVLLSVRTLSAQEGVGKGPSLPPPPPEARRVVDAIVGRWEGRMTATVPGAAPETFAWTMDCRPAALSAGATCTIEGHPSIGELSESCLVAYDSWSQSVHFMCVTSMGEVHDHKGRWKDGDTIAFEPLTGGLQGKVMTETITWTFAEPRRLTTRSLVTLEDGATMSFEFHASR